MFTKNMGIEHIVGDLCCKVGFHKKIVVATDTDIQTEQYNCSGPCCDAGAGGSHERTATTYRTRYKCSRCGHASSKTETTYPPL